MTLAEALDIVIGRTGVERYRYLCFEYPSAREQAKWRAWVIKEARGENLPDITASLEEGFIKPGCGPCPGGGVP